MGENGNEIPAQIGMITIQFDTKTVQQELLAKHRMFAFPAIQIKKQGELQKVNTSGNHHALQENMWHSLVINGNHLSYW